jgi:hypothetical protein
VRVGGDRQNAIKTKSATAEIEHAAAACMGDPNHPQRRDDRRMSDGSRMVKRNRPPAGVSSLRCGSSRTLSTAFLEESPCCPLASQRNNVVARAKRY